MPRNTDRDEEREDRIRQLMERAKKQQESVKPAARVPSSEAKATKPRKARKKK